MSKIQKSPTFDKKFISIERTNYAQSGLDCYHHILLIPKLLKIALKPLKSIVLSKIDPNKLRAIDKENE